VRLVYADWLDDNGEHERAEFIRLQCALPRLPEDDDRRVALEKRERELYSAQLDLLRQRFGKEAVWP
jgi:hypothetical protein